MKNILVPTDFSDLSLAASKIAIDLAKKHNSEIHFLHIFSAPFNWKELRPEQEELYPQLKKDFHNANRELDLLVNQASKLGLKANRFMLFNEARNAIDQHIQDHEHDFVVMGSNGTSGIDEVMGSNTQKVVRNARVPVLVIKDPNATADFKKIVFATSLEAQASTSFERIIQFAKEQNAELNLLYVNRPDRFKETSEINREISEFMKNSMSEDVSFYVENALNAERGIINFSDRIGADLIVLSTHGKTGLLNLFSPSVTENVVNHANCSVIGMNIYSK